MTKTIVLTALAIISAVLSYFYQAAPATPDSTEVQRIKKDSIRTGDLVFFRRSPKQPVFHVDIYLKNNKFIHSATNGGVMVSSLREPYYRNYYYAAGRVD